MISALSPVMAPTPTTPPPAPTPPAAAPAPNPAAATNTSGSVPDFSPPVERNVTPPPPTAATEDAPTTAAQWKEFKAKEQARYEALQKEYTELKTKSTTTAPNGDYETLKKQNEELNKRLAAHAIEKHPKFQEYFDGRIKQQVDTVARLGGDVGKKIATVITQPDSDHRNAILNDLMEQLSTVDRSKVGAVMVQLDNIQSERQAEIAKADQTYAKMNQDQTAQYEQRKGHIDKITNEVLESARKAIPLLQPRDGDKQWNQGVKSIEGQVRHLLHGKLEDRDVAKAAIWSALAPSLLQELNARNIRVTELEAHIAKLQAVSPDPSRPSGTPETKPVDDPNESFGDRVARLGFGR